MAMAASSLQITASKPCIFSAKNIFRGNVANIGMTSLAASWAKLSSACHVSSSQHFNRTFTSSPAKFDKAVTKAMSETGESRPASGLAINLKGLTAFIT